jgi:hypothetical protein
MASIFLNSFLKWYQYNLITSCGTGSCWGVWVSPVFGFYGCFSFFFPILVPFLYDWGHLYAFYKFFCLPIKNNFPSHYIRSLHSPLKLMILYHQPYQLTYLHPKPTTKLHCYSNISNGNCHISLLLLSVTDQVLR